MDLSVKLRKYCLLLIVPLICFKSFSQSIVTDFKSGSLIIPMDNTRQGLASGVAFNVKAYGLVNLLLQNNIPVNWIIRDSKLKDEADFSVLSARTSPSSTAASVVSYSGGPFIVDSLWAAKAAPIISAYGNSVAVYTAQVAFQAPVRYQLTFKPKIAVFTNGGSPLIHTKALRLAGFTSPAHFDSIQAQNSDNAGTCYTFATEPHWAGGTAAITAHVNNFVLSGGNFFAQCAGVGAYENLEHFHTTNGIDFETVNGNKDNTNLYPVATHPLTQFDGQLVNAPTGTVVNYKNNGGSYQPSTEFLIKKNPSPASGVANGDVVLSSRKVGSTASGGIVSYFGGHDYLKSTFDLLDLGILGLEFARANDVTWNNGLRVFYNAIFIPPSRPTTCNVVFAADVVVTSAIGNNQPCVGGTVNYTVSITNNGPGTANNVLVKTIAPGGLTYSSAAPGQGTYNNGNGIWTVGNISPGSTLNMVLTYTVPTAGSFTFKSYNADLIAANSFLNDTTTLSLQTDYTPPTVTAPANVNATTNSGCTATGVVLGTPTTSDNCGIASVTSNAPSAFPLGTTIVTWTVTDNSGLSATAQQTVTVTDNVNPTVTAPANIITTTNSGCTATGALGTPTVSDNCGVASVSNNAPAAFPLGTTTVTWTVTDNSGNTATAQQTVTVTDNVNPTITAPANIITTTNSGCTAPGVALGTPITSDNCGIASVSNNAPAAFPLGTTTVTWTVTDNSGNTATAQQTVTVTDNVNPTITAPANVNATTNSGCTATGVALGTPTTSDNCGIASVSNNAPAAFPLGTTTVTWTVTDNSGNTATAQQTVTVTDNENPTITSPGNISVNQNNGCGASAFSLGTPITSDNCGVASVTSNAPSFFPVGTTAVTWTVTDNSGNQFSAIQNVTVIDIELPVITAPADIAASTNSGCSATVALGMPVTSDNCTVSSVTNDAPAVFPIGTTTVTWTVTDNSGNTATAQQTVTVADTEDPTITAPANISVNANAGCEATGVALGTPMTADNCGVASVTNDAPSVFVPGTTTVTWTVTDNSGNTATASQTVTVTDDELPVITAPANTILNTNLGCTASGLAIGTPVVSDNCGIAMVTNDAPAAFPLGVTTVTWTATDNSGNSSTATQDITVIDAEDPTITAPSDIAIATNDGCTATGVALGIPATADNCGVASVTHDGSSVFPLGTTAVTWTVTDNSGNTASAIQQVTVSDNEAPAITAPANINTEAEDGCLAEGVVLGTPVTTDNCGVASVTNDAPAAFSVGVTVVTWTVTDNSGNTSTATQTVTVEDQETPTITAPANIASTTNSGCTATGIALGTPATSDNCGVASVSNDGPSAFPLGTTTITWTVTDNAGNTATATQTVTITDTEAPAISNCGDTIVSCVAEVTFAAPQASDNCSVATFVQSDPTGLQSGSSFPAGYTTLEYTATDGSGNVTICTKTIRVIVVTAVPDAGEDQTVFLPETQLNASLNGAAAGTWEVISGTAALQDYESAVTMAYGLDKGTNGLTWTVSEDGCNGLSDTLLITYVDLDIPNGFSPDGDNVNDRFEIVGLESFAPVSLTVLNRWGVTVYASNDYQNDWDGTSAGGQPLSDDTYYYQLTLNDHTELTGFLLLEHK